MYVQVPYLILHVETYKEMDPKKYAGRGTVMWK